MIYAMKVAWLLKSYGHDKLSVINGGFEEWKKKGYEISKDDVKLKPGNWSASDNISKYNITFEQLEEDHGDRKYIEWMDDLNLLDARIRDQFDGTGPTSLNKDVTGTHISGFKNLPAAELVKDGLLKNSDELQNWLFDNGFTPDKPTVVLCNAGVQAAMLAYVINTVFPHNPIQLYNVSTCRKYQVLIGREGRPAP
ncbi:hypothetical protein OESDEN_02523 [Oesophagostomum dentatum]|uniref:Rhodanese domain-containing protein n=1 Tax=Oesophagostomum dentatum TaxID=61180 RepID=A0A0B1TIV7_OESDE|nr:hypothetical protein OESDEN_02523 [Oesophagostomum dentatum]